VERTAPNTGGAWTERFKPAAGARTQLGLAAVMWSTVGLVLAAAGASWVWRSTPGSAPWLLGGAAAVGVLKSRLVLDRTARRIVGRIRARGDGRCLGGFLSLRSWALVALMVAGGRLLRTSHLARSWLGFLYVAIGIALASSSRVSWREWMASRKPEEGSTV
jgi:hypothetical protein